MKWGHHTSLRAYKIGSSERQIPNTRACRDYKALLVLFVLANNHALANFHHPRRDLNTSQRPNSKSNNR
jgi:hypothetical protein